MECTCTYLRVRARKVKDEGDDKEEDAGQARDGEGGRNGARPFLRTGACKVLSPKMAAARIRMRAAHYIKAPNAPT